MTDLDNRIINLFDKGYLPSDIGRRVGLPALSVRERLSVHGIAAPTSSRVTESHLWEHLDDDARRDRIIAQDMKFRAAMKREHFPDPPALPMPPPRRPHQFLDVGYRPEMDERPSPLHWKRIQLQTANKHGLTVAEILSKRRDKRVIAARRECCWRLKRETSMSLPQIGSKMGGLDHTTVLYHVRAFERELKVAGKASAA